jgi:tetratricopeptide (TPR) repeat protein
MISPSLLRGAAVRAIALACLLCCAPVTHPVYAQSTALAASGAAERAFTRGDPVPAWVDRIAAIPPAPSGHPLSIRLADVIFHVGQDAAEYHHKAFAAHEASSLGALGQFDIQFQPDYQRVRLHRLALLRGKQVIDKLASADIRFLQRERSLEQGIYDGSVTAQIVTTDVRVGDTLEIEYTVVGQNPVFAGHVLEAAQVDYSGPVQLRRVTIDVPQDKNIAYRLLGNGPGPVPAWSEQQRDGRHRLRYEMKAVAPLIGETSVPFDAHQFRWVQISDFLDWADVNAWALDLFSAQTPPAVLSAPLRAARAAKTREEAVARVLEYVQNEIRYLSVSLGESSHRPFSPATVLERGYGDCKDKTLLAVTMLRELGIDAEPVLVATYTTKGLATMLPSPTLFDHAIVRVTVNGKRYFLDPTRLGQYGALDRMGQAHGGREVLVVKAGVTALDTIPLQSREFMTSKRFERALVTAFGKPAEFQTRIETAGVDAEAMRVQLGRLSKQELRKAYEGALVKRYPDARLVGEPTITDDRQRNTLSIETRHSIAALLKESPDGGWDLSYSPTNLSELFAPPGTAQRTFALAVPAYPYAYEYALELVLPAGVDLPAQSFNRAVDDRAFLLQRKLEVGKRSMRVEVLLDTREDRVQPGRVPHYLKNLHQFDEIVGGSLHVPRPGAAVAATRAEATAVTAEARLEQTVTAIGRVIADADSMARDPSASLCERALALAYLGRKAEALKDLARAAQLQPQSNTMLRCRADTNYILGRFKESEADYAKAIARGDDTPGAYLGRGLATLYLNRNAAAQADFQVAAAKADESAERLRAQVLQQMAGGAVAPGAADDDGQYAWLTVARAMFGGSAEPESMVSQSSRGVPSGSQGQLVEAYYYAGRYHLAKNNALKARVYFQRALDKKILDNPYHVAARHELARM